MQHLIILMAFSGQDQHIVLFCMAERPFDRRIAVRDDFIRRVRMLQQAGLCILDDLHLVLIARVIRCKNHKVGQARYNFSHLFSLCTVTVASAAKQRYNAPAREFLHRCNDLFQPVGAVRVIADHDIIRPCRQHLDAAHNPLAGV